MYSSLANLKAMVIQIEVSKYMALTGGDNY